MKKKVLFITASDIHFADWGQFNKDGRRITAHLNVWAKLEALCTFYDCALLFPGDLFHNPKHLSNRLLNKVLPTLIKTPIMVIGIDGNHDQDGISTPTKQPHGYMGLMEKISLGWNCINFSSINMGNITIWGIPYLTHNIGFTDYVDNMDIDPNRENILIIHTDLPGAVDPSGREVATAEGLTKQYSKLFSKFNLVLAGHIHKPQKLASNVIMVGAPQQQSRGDRKCDFGYWKIYEDLSIEFFALDTPKFKTALSDEETDEFNYWDIEPQAKQDQDKAIISPKVNTEAGAISKYVADTGMKRTKANILKKLINKAKND